MDTAVCGDRFWEMFKGRAVVVSQLPVGHSRVLATAASEMADRDGASLRTKAEYKALYGLLLAQVPPAPAGKLRLLDEARAPHGRRVCDQGLHRRVVGEAGVLRRGHVHVPCYRVLSRTRCPDRAGETRLRARVDVWKTDPADRQRIPSPGGGGVLFSTQAFTLKNSGNRTLRAPKPSWRIILDAAGHDNRLAGMTRINLKAMYNDPSQMREALAWRLFGVASIPAPRHTYAKLAFDATYRGLFSVIEHVDKKFLGDHFGENQRGNLYKTGCRESDARASHTGPDPAAMTGGASILSREVQNPPTASRPTRITPRPAHTTTWPVSSGRSTASGCGVARSGSIRTPSASQWTT